MSAFDAIVVGAGVIGAGTAFALARSGFRVALLDTGPVGSAPGETGGTSRASFAWINATAKTDREDYHRLNAAGVEHYRSLAREFGEARLGLHPTGMIAWAHPDDDDRRRGVGGEGGRRAAPGAACHICAGRRGLSRLRRCMARCAARHRSVL